MQYTVHVCVSAVHSICVCMCVCVQVPLEKLGERREWRERRLAALMTHKTEMKKQEEQETRTQ